MNNQQMNTPAQGTDANDLHVLCGLDELKKQLLAAESGAGVPKKPSQQNIKKSKAPDGGEDAQGYSVHDAGLFYFDGDRRRRLCSRLDIVAHARNRNGLNWGLLVRFRDYDGIEKQWNIPRPLFATDGGAEVIRGLYDRGLEIESGRESKKRLLEYLQGVGTENRVVLVDKMGWHGAAFLLPAGVIGTPTEALYYYNDSATVCKMSSAGELAEWRDNVARWCVGNPLPCFAVSAAFAAPLLDILGTESSGFHFVGDSSLGKSTLLKVAASVCGNPTTYPRTWRATDNALEATASAYSDCLLVLDEIGQCDPRIIGETIYMLGNGEGKARANDRGGARDVQHRWKLVFLSSGEKTLTQHMAEANRKPQAGMEMRFLTIPACTHDAEATRRNLGIYDSVFDFANGAALSDHLLQQSAKYYGTALPAFLEKLTAPDMRSKASAYMLEVRNNFAHHHLSQDASGQAKRAADKFALIGAAGELATEFGLTGWGKGEALRAADKLFNSWLALRGGDGSYEELQIIEQLRHHFQTFGESRYTRWDSESEKDAVIGNDHTIRTMERYGFRRTDKKADPLAGDSTETVFYVFPASFRGDVCKGIDYKRAQRLLADRGALQRQKDRYTTKQRLPGFGSRPVDCYMVKFSLLCAGSDNAGGGDV